MNYKNLYYYKFDDEFGKIKNQISDGTEYAIVINRDTMCYVMFKETQNIGLEKLYDADAVVQSHVDWWEKHPDTFPQWQTRGEEPEVEIE